MGRMLPAVIKDPFEQVPAGVLKFVVDEAKEVWLGKTGEEVYGIEISMTVTEPKEAEGISHREGFFIGIGPNDKAVKDGKVEADPACEKDGTFAARGGRFKKCCEAAGFSIEGADLDEVFQVLQGKEILGKVEHVPSKNNPELINARVSRWMPVGMAEVGISNGAPTPAAKPTAMPGPTPAARPAAVGTAPTARPTVTPPARPQARSQARLGR